MSFHNTHFRNTHSMVLGSLSTEGYRIILQQFKLSCTKNEVLNVEAITVQFMQKYILYFQRKGNHAATTISKLQRIHSFLNDMIECEGMKENPARKIAKANVERLSENQTKRKGILHLLYPH